MKQINLTTIQLNTKKIIRVLSFCTVILLIINIFLQTLHYAFNIKFRGFSMLRNLFNADLENNIPTIFSYAILLFATLLLAIISIVKKNQKDKNQILWWIITCIFFLVGTDEILGSHELMAISLRKIFNFSGFFFFAWVIPFAIILFLLSIIFFKFIFLYLPPQTRKKFIIAAIIYIGGALGLEFIGGYFFTNWGGDNLSWIILTTFEEGLEMVGIIYFILALLEYFQNQIGQVLLTATSENPAE